MEGIRQRHHRKTSFMPKFEKTVQDEPTNEPLFLDTARKHWSSQRPRHS